LVTFRERLLATLRAMAPLFEESGVMVVGSEVPNLLEPDAAATLVISQDVDLAIPVARHGRVKRRLRELPGFHPSPEEPSVWLPDSPQLLEVNFLGLDPGTRDASDTYVFEDSELPLLVFGLLSLLRPGEPVLVGGIAVPVPRLSGLLLEKLATERSGEKGDRDLLVALGLLLVSSPGDLEELAVAYRGLTPELRHDVRANLVSLALLQARDGMPDPGPHRTAVNDLRRRLEEVDEGFGGR
jgi:hypothetical protein